MPDTVKYRFTRRDRLTKTEEFSSVFGFRKAIRGQWLMLHYQPRSLQNSDLSSSPILPDATVQTARLGLVVGKKLLKRAVDRNRLKRVVRENFRLRCAELPPCDLVVRLAVKGVPLYAGPPAEGQFCLQDDINALFDRLLSRHQRHATKAETTAETTTATAAHPV